ncbi:3-keto-5-aminohexanoate cleavage protein [uncultured Deinococcus sp.]|uniref:3-keto-5-aminohexanoate cleavage protein n=1 Tax=uncultured Deinococcus sp. TaxID=158789 RepID=UPI0025E66483|nr:3-keto-5-aminohexanoate cleavage protein [uncultured Deinococcus sp.]
MLKACLNGNRAPGSHPALPLTPAALARDAAGVVALGVAALHLHPRGPDGLESLAAADIAAALQAVRAACPGIPVGISSGYWILPDVGAQLDAARLWAALPEHARPDFVSVNLHEPHALLLADLVLAAGIGVEAGIWNTAAVAVFRAWPRAHETLRVLVELPDVPEVEAVALADGLLRELAGVAPHVPRLLHGLERSAWPMIRLAGQRGLSTRTGLEDSAVLPDGSPAPDNAALVTAARAVLASAR